MSDNELLLLAVVVRDAATAITMSSTASAERREREHARRLVADLAVVLLEAKVAMPAPVRERLRKKLLIWNEQHGSGT